jgi:hypothetical protein
MGERSGDPRQWRRDLRRPALTKTILTGPIEEVKDAGYARADEVFAIPEAYRAKDAG